MKALLRTGWAGSEGVAWAARPGPTLRASCARRCAAAPPRSRVLRRAAPDHPDRTPGPQDTAEDPAAALAVCLAHIEAGDLDSLLEFVPDEVIDKVIEMRRCAAGGGEPTWLRFTDVLNANLSSSLLYLDSFAVRHLAHAAPAKLQLLSAVRVSPDRYLQRCGVEAAAGERAVLAFEMVLQECLENQYRGPPLMRKRWMLRSVRGEPVAEPGAPPLTQPAPAHSPEAVLQAQLASLREQNFAGVFAHASPANKRATGPVQQFARMLQSPAYMPLLAHAGAETLQRLQPSPTVFMELVRVFPGPAARARLERLGQQAGSGGGGERKAQEGVTYLWVLSRQQGGPLAGCWMVDSVTACDSFPPAAE